MQIILVVFYLLLILFGISFAALNAASVPVNLYVTKLTMPISVLMTGMLALGVCLGFCLFLARYWRVKAELRRVSNQLKLTEREIKNLRSIPIQDQH
ncbi:MAG: LapA family protein [Legionellales bacterium]|nr:LapA family protein [Legionellales bacterium]